MILLMRDGLGLVIASPFLRACDTHVAAGDPAHNGPVMEMNRNATTWRIDFFLDPQGELSYSPSHLKQVLITSPIVPLSQSQSVGRPYSGVIEPADSVGIPDYGEAIGESEPPGVS